MFHTISPRTSFNKLPRINMESYNDIGGFRGFDHPPPPHQTELEELQAKLQGMDNYRDELKNIEAQMNCIEDENKRLRKSLSQVHFDNKALRELVKDMTEMQIHKPRVDEEMGGAFVPRLPPSCVGSRRRRPARRRQHTRKSRGVLTTVLPPIGENNKIVGFPQKATPSLRVNERQSLARRTSLGNICPCTTRKDTSSRRQQQSGVPLSSAMSVGNVPRGCVRHLKSWK